MVHVSIVVCFCLYVVPAPALFCMSMKACCLHERERENVYDLRDMMWFCLMERMF
jgi:hypothetical protein